MKFSRLAVVAILVFLGACQDIHNTPKPDNLISEDKMVRVLTELTLVHSARNYNRREMENTGIQANRYIYNKFGIDSLQFARSNNYYADKYNEYDGIYARVKDTLEAMKVKLDSLREREIEVEDSIRNAKIDSIAKKNFSNTVGDSKKAQENDD